MRILRALLVLIVIIIAAAAVIAATLPASTAYNYFGDKLGALKLSGLSGTIWDGRASSAQVFGQELGALTWQLKAKPLLTDAVVDVHLNLDGGAVAATTDAQRSQLGEISVSNGTFHFPASLASPALDIPQLNLLGDIEGKLDHAQLNGVLLTNAGGTLHWKNAAVSGAAQAQLGELEASFSSDTNGVIHGTAHDLGGPLKLDGTFNVGGGNFDVDAHLAPRDGNPQVAEALRFIGQPEADGSSHLIIRGQLFKVF
jgi:general secretion pathway protein N